METAFLVWSAAPAASQDRRAGVFLPHAGGAARPSPSRKKPSAPRKPPQRGLGVEQLERLRLQEQWRKITTRSRRSRRGPPPACPTTSPPLATGWPWRAAASRWAAMARSRSSLQAKACNETAAGGEASDGEGDAGLGEGKHPLHLFLADRMDDQGGTEVRRRRSPETELKERMFFPCSSKLGAATRAIDESSSSPSLAIGGNQLDLSLKLSF
ncbi:unnamed protein product [Spirodela intermedia]|uniref:Uncharacterized protein n=1 Tax=Spirodela intermedia TaxID=51605 RepID=A0A7I8IHT2_SPIIN|nr:unnamed protein product [Spirodela intermedia]CAA6656633.1 unnamed protein product [Spirodela intermedia]